MSPRRRRIVSVQAAAVALLVMLVYLTLLRPESHGPLRGIQAPGGETQVNAGPDPDHDADRRDARARGAATPSAGGALTLSVGGALTLSAGVSEPGGATPGDVPPTLVRNTPTDDQYTDSVEALLRKVGAGSGISE
ncbi:MAG: hypothetical protein ACR2G3_04800 [Solirubrobacterales bacterium]